MLCQHCQQREANVQIYQTENGHTTELHLCEVCAQQAQEVSFIFQPVIVPEFLQALFGLTSTQPQPTEKVCPKCGISFSKITKAGKLGCSSCYEAFETELEPLLRRIHGSGQNVGKIPVRQGSEIKSRLEERKLKEKLQVLIQQENFEEAALVRDQIRQLEQRKGGENHDT